ncbi:3-hydroxybutyryl-CoA dehydratase [Mesorhizobium sp. L-8-10]|uniref:enoyl-CoA hydratase/isomerase family protein n=1 Tax=Mesorhizobium sp. L-8-10 TaxID=2744523 RepID=UPI0019261862|nr:enoyl-CoA hydratase/isomerase family protein [Mesorhizobium sp. L-8-10]BCH28226.1 3-hydroxybutyryl-CoA dehydratase [Mesorhizobium sp. L-8-10]
MEKSEFSGAPVSLDWPTPQVARLTLDRGTEFNTLAFAMLRGLDEALDKAHTEGARVAIVTGSGKAFCCGAEVSYFTDPSSDLANNPLAIRERYVRQIIRTFRKLRDMPFVTIAAINGFALGGGCEMALSCDFRLIASNARIGLTEARLGAVPGAGGVQMLSAVVGRAKALEIILLADQWSAEEALSAGLVHSVHSQEALDDAALALARRLLLCSPISIAESKRAINRCETSSADEADEIALDAVAAAASGADWREGMRAFRERRPPRFAEHGIGRQGSGNR